MIAGIIDKSIRNDGNGQFGHFRNDDALVVDNLAERWDSLKVERGQHCGSVACPLIFHVIFGRFFCFPFCSEFSASPLRTIHTTGVSFGAAQY